MAGESAPDLETLRLRVLSLLSGTPFAACAAKPNAMQEIQLTAFDVNQRRQRLQKMTDDELREFGKAAAYMVSPKANMGQPPGETFVIQLAEARSEWALMQACPSQIQWIATLDRANSGSRRFGRRSLKVTKPQCLVFRTILEFARPALLSSN